MFRGAPHHLQQIHQQQQNAAQKQQQQQGWAQQYFELNFFFKFWTVYSGVTSARGVENNKIERHPVRNC